MISFEELPSPISQSRRHQVPPKPFMCKTIVLQGTQSGLAYGFSKLRPTRAKERPEEAAPNVTNRTLSRRPVSAPFLEWLPRHSFSPVGSSSGIPFFKPDTLCVQFVAALM